MSQAESRVCGDSNMTFPVSCNTDYGKAPGVECPHKGRTVKRASMNWLEVEAVANKEKGPPLLTSNGGDREVSLGFQRLGIEG